MRSLMSQNYSPSAVPVEAVCSAAVSWEPCTLAIDTAPGNAGPLPQTRRDAGHSGWMPATPAVPHQAFPEAKRQMSLQGCGGELCCSRAIAVHVR